MQILDNYDKKLLLLMQKNNKLTAQEISNQINLSQSAVQRRLKRLRESKIIEADVSIISPAASGVGLTCLVDVVLHEGSIKAIDNFKTAMIKCPEVSHCYYVTGAYDFVLVINTRDMMHFEEFQKNNLMDHPNLKHFYTHVVMDRAKIAYGVQM